MARTTKPLTNTEVQQAKAREKEYNLVDGGGLMLRVKPNGTKSWIFNYYHPHTKKRKNIGFGKYPEVTLAEAREKRLSARKLVANNVDPKYQKEQTALEQKEAMENTFGVFAEKWYQLKLKAVKKETADKAWQILDKHVLPQLEATPVHQLKPKMVIDILKPIEAKGSRETVKRLCRTINEVMRLALASGHIEVNYLTDITKLFAAPQKKNMATIEPARLPELMQKLAQANIMLVTRCLVE